MLLGFRTVRGAVPILKQLVECKNVLSTLLLSESEVDCTFNGATDQKSALDSVDIFESPRQVFHINILTVTIDKSVIREGVDCRTAAANVALAWGLELVSFWREMLCQVSAAIRLCFDRRERLM